MATPTKNPSTATKSPASKSSPMKPCCDSPKCASNAKSGEFSKEICCLTDKDIISDILGGEKSLIKLYGTVLCESSTDKLRSLVNKSMSECAADQFDAFNFMAQRGLYPTTPAEAQKVTEAKTKFKKYSQEMK